ncbi:MAG: CHAT domain-containing protein [Holophagales bacterium]|nr:CHAT domain-containing protein [Holophagales bacterium]MYC10622.1 CHAT domain-containing protein [Holophagales bacterium]
MSESRKRGTPQLARSAATRAVAVILGLGVLSGPAAWAQSSGEGPSPPEHLRPTVDGIATLIYDASPGRPVRLTVVPDPKGLEPTTLTLETTAEDLKPLVAEIRELALLRPPASLGRIVRLGDQLGELLLAPVADHLRSVPRLGLSANGPLSDLPFGLVRAPRSIDPLGRYLIEARTLCWIDPALGDGNAADRPASDRPVALAIADAVYRPPARPLGASMSDGGISWRQHAARRNQAGTIRGLGLRVVSRFGQAASPALFWESTESYAVRFLHLAVEGRIDPDDADRSALLLSPEEYDEQAIPVTAGQLASRLALEREALVVLSGLDTGDHGIGPGPFVEAFGAAGAGSLVASLWPVVDESATHLFATFYSNLAQGATASRALREAQLQLLAQSLVFDQGEGRAAVEFDASHPYYWSGYRVYRESASACG